MNQQSVDCFPWSRRSSQPNLHTQKDMGKKDLGSMKRSLSERKLAREKKKEERQAKSRSVHFDGKGGSAEQNGQVAEDPSKPGSNNFIWSIKSKMKKRMNSQEGRDGTEGDDEGFESSPEKGAETMDPAPLATTEDLEDNNNPGEETADGTMNTNSEEKKETKEEDKQLILTKSPYFRIELAILSGQNLVAMDRGGTSDPYVKVLQGDDVLHKTPEKKKTVNPIWNDGATAYIKNPFNNLLFQVYDKDVVGTDDFMGQVEFSLTENCDINKPAEFSLNLEPGEDEDLLRKVRKKKPLGFIVVRITLSPMTKEEYNEVLRTQKASGAGGKLSYSAIVHVVLVQARGLMAMDAGISSDSYCKVTLGKEKHKSKTISKSLNPKWREPFDLFWYQELDDYLELALFDHDVGGKDDFMGRVSIDLRELAKEVSHNLWRPIVDGQGQVNAIVTITGTTNPDEASLLDNWEPESNWEKKLAEKYQIANSFHKIKDVGHLTVKVIKATGLHSADIGGKSDPFAVIEVCNSRVQTQTEYKTLTPVWQKVFTFDIKDIHDIVEATVYDEDKDHKFEFLGKVMIPLLRVQNGEKKWYKLKNKDLRKKAKGDDPQILLEMNLYWNPIRASIRTINPKQIKYEDKSDTKFKFSTFNKNVNRIKAITAGMDPELAIRELKSILNWESKAKSSGAFIGFLLGVWFLEPWMLTCGLLIPFIQNIILLTVTGGWNKSEEDAEEEEEAEAEADPAKKEESEKKSLKEKMEAMQDIALMVQIHLGTLAHVMESGKNVFNFSVPFLSWLAFTIFFVVTIVLYYIPLRVLLILWGTNKFTKKLIKPNAISNNEVLDYISRVPDNEELKNYKEISKTEEIDKKTLAKMKKNALRDADII